MYSLVTWRHATWKIRNKVDNPFLSHYIAWPHMILYLWSIFQLVSVDKLPLFLQGISVPPKLLAETSLWLFMMPTLHEQLYIVFSFWKWCKNFSHSFTRKVLSLLYFFFIKPHEVNNKLCKRVYVYSHFKYTYWLILPLILCSLIYCLKKLLSTSHVI